jgi:hypothetical protein
MRALRTRVDTLAQSLLHKMHHMHKHDTNTGMPHTLHVAHYPHITLHTSPTTPHTALIPSTPCSWLLLGIGNSASTSSFATSYSTPLPAPTHRLQAANALFFNTAGGNTQTLQGWYQGCSMGRTLLTSATSKVVSVTLPCSGTTSTGTAWTSATCDTYAYSQAANDAVAAAGLATLANYP